MFFSKYFDVSQGSFIYLVSPILTKPGVLSINLVIFVAKFPYSGPSISRPLYAQRPKPFLFSLLLFQNRFSPFVGGCVGRSHRIQLGAGAQPVWKEDCRVRTSSLRKAAFYLSIGFSPYSSIQQLDNHKLWLPWVTSLRISCYPGFFVKCVAIFESKECGLTRN